MSPSGGPAVLSNGAASEGPPRPATRVRPATLLGSTAARSLVEGARGRVLAVVSGAAYLRLNDGVLLWLSGPGGIAHPRAILAALNPEALPPGEDLLLKDGLLVVGRKLRVDIRHAPVWPAARFGSGGRRDPAGADLVVRRLTMVIAEGVLSGSPFGDLPLAGGFRERLALATNAASATLPEGTGDADAALLALADELLGLGPGLTPSGDDFIGGLLFAAHVARAAWRDTGGPSPEAVDRVLTIAAARTNTISLALIEDYARGDGPEPLLRLTECLLGGMTEPALEAARALVRIGQSTGWSTLAGFCAGLTTTLWDRTQGRPPVT